MKPQIQINLIKGYTIQDTQDMTLGFVQAVSKHFPKFSTGEIAEMLMNEQIEIV